MKRKNKVVKLSFLIILISEHFVVKQYVLYEFVCVGMYVIER